MSVFDSKQNMTLSKFYLKQAQKHINYRLLLCYLRIVTYDGVFQNIFLSMYLFHLMNFMLEVICMGLVEMGGKGSKRPFQCEKVLVDSEIRTHNPRLIHTTSHDVMRLIF